MRNAIDVAHYFLNKADRDAGDAPTHLWLQKVVFYAQAWSFVFLSEPLFAEPVEAWEHGPVVESVWQEYKKFERHVISEQPTIDPRLFSKEEMTLLRVVWERYGGLTASRLRSLTHSEAPWLNARQGLQDNEPSKNPISPEDMRTYYGKFGGIINKEFLIERRSEDLNKDKTFVTVYLTDGSHEQVDINALGTFVANHSESIEYESSTFPSEGVELF
jgi:uncharacterized phage-associated protein